MLVAQTRKEMRRDGIYSKAEVTLKTLYYFFCVFLVWLISFCMRPRIRSPAGECAVEMAENKVDGTQSTSKPANRENPNSVQTLISFGVKVFRFLNCNAQQRAYQKSGPPQIFIISHDCLPFLYFPSASACINFIAIIHSLSSEKRKTPVSHRVDRTKWKCKCIWWSFGLQPLLIFNSCHIRIWLCQRLVPIESRSGSFIWMLFCCFCFCLWYECYTCVSFKNETNAKFLATTVRLSYNFYVVVVVVDDVPFWMLYLIFRWVWRELCIRDLQT